MQYSIITQCKKFNTIYTFYDIFSDSDLYQSYQSSASVNYCPTVSSWEIISCFSQSQNVPKLSKY